MHPAINNTKIAHTFQLNLLFATINYSQENEKITSVNLPRRGCNGHELYKQKRIERGFYAYRSRH